MASLSSQPPKELLESLVLWGVPTKDVQNGKSKLLLERIDRYTNTPGEFHPSPPPSRTSTEIYEHYVSTPFKVLLEEQLKSELDYVSSTAEGTNAKCQCVVWTQRRAGKYPIL